MLLIPSQSNPTDSLKIFKSSLIWIIYFALGVCAAYSALYLAKFFSQQTSVLPGYWDNALWGVAVFAVIAFIAYQLELNIVKGYFKIFLSIGLLVSICAMAVGVVTVLIGFVGEIGMIPISSLLFALCLLFSSDFFETSRLKLLIRFVAAGFIAGLIIGLIGLIV